MRTEIEEALTAWRHAARRLDSAVDGIARLSAPTSTVTARAFIACRQAT